MMTELVVWIAENQTRFAYMAVAGAVNFIANKRAGKAFPEFFDEFLVCLGAAWAVEKIMFLATGLPPGMEFLACILIGLNCRAIMDRFGLKKPERKE